MRIILGVLLSVLSFGYLLPAGIAIARGRTNMGAIITLNFFLGWTLVGWVVALSWSVATDIEKKKVADN